MEDCLNIVEKRIQYFLHFKTKIKLKILCDIENCRWIWLEIKEIARLMPDFVSNSRWINFPGFNWSNLWTLDVDGSQSVYCSRGLRGFAGWNLGNVCWQGRFVCHWQDQRDSMRFSDRWLNLLMERNCLSLSRYNIPFRGIKRGIAY